MTPRAEITIEPGTIFSIEGLWSAHLLRINQKAYNRFELVFDDYETAMLIGIEAPAGSTRTPLEGAHRNIDALTLRPWDQLTIPGLHERTLGSIVELREGRFQLRLEKKYAEAVNADVVTPVAQERHRRLRAEMNSDGSEQ